MTTSQRVLPCYFRDITTRNNTLLLRRRARKRHRYKNTPPLRVGQGQTIVQQFHMSLRRGDEDISSRKPLSNNRTYSITIKLKLPYQVSRVMSLLEQWVGNENKEVRRASVAASASGAANDIGVTQRSDNAVAAHLNTPFCLLSPRLVLLCFIQKAVFCGISKLQEIFTRFNVDNGYG